MPSKKKKYNSRFPPARIKKIMQTDDEIGKVAAAVPVLISKCLEMFLSSILTSAGEVTKAKRAKTMSTSHLKECIMNANMFDFLQDVVADVPDMQNEDEPSTSAAAVAASSQESSKKISRKRSAAALTSTKKRPKTRHDSSEDEGDSEENDNRNGGLMLLSSSEQVNPEVKSEASDERKASFHISLDALMSQEGGGAPACTDQVLHAVRPEVKKTEQVAVSEVLADYTAAIEKSDPTNGLSSPQKPMDLSVNHSETRLSGSQDGSSKEEAPPAYWPGVAGAAQAAVGTSHLRNPAAASQFAPPVPQASFSKDLNAKVPKGGMLNFLYSGYPGDVPPPSAGTTAPVDVQHRGKGTSGTQKSYNTSAPEMTYPYPYNPLAEHKRLPPGAHPYLPKTVEPQKPPTAVGSLQNKEDDDYDT